MKLETGVQSFTSQRLIGRDPSDLSDRSDKSDKNHRIRKITPKTRHLTPNT
jgi:hypothetical protein